ncbi:unnamed protein product [Gadus morhua 'NCC']
MAGSERGAEARSLNKYQKDEDDAHRYRILRAYLPPASPAQAQARATASRLTPMPGSAGSHNYRLPPAHTSLRSAGEGSDAGRRQNRARPTTHNYPPSLHQPRL